MKHSPAEKLLSFLEKKPLLAWALVAGYAATIFILSSMSYPPQPIEPGSKLAADIISTAEHLTEYAIFGFLLLAALGSRSGIVRENAATLAILAATFYGATDEIHQYFVPYRECNIIDLAADFLGASMGVFIGKHKRA